MAFKPEILTAHAFGRCLNTVSSNAFYFIVGDALCRKDWLSVVRMGDGEFYLMNDTAKADPNAIVRPPIKRDKVWMDILGCTGITNGLLRDRMIEAATDCSFFAPSLSGVVMNDFAIDDLFPWRKLYIDNFFVNAWTPSMIAELFIEAQHVLLIHRSLHTADAMQINAKKYLGVKVSHLRLGDWRDSGFVIKEAALINAPLVLFSAGPACKYIGTRIAAQGKGKVTIDVGNAIDSWTLDGYTKERE